MANPTTYFGWVMPTATDLVTDLPADFNVFGQGVDTSMQDLLGGTTGQVLSKTSNTNMDFTWVTPTDETPLTTKGDLFTFTTVDARLGIGANNTVLTADSAQATGMKWAAPAGGGKVLQVVSATTTSGTSIATTTMTDTTITATITPTSATSQILILISVCARGQCTTGTNHVAARLQRNGTTIADYGGGSSVSRFLRTNTTDFLGMLSVTDYDAPASTSALTYKLQAAVENTANSMTAEFQLSSTPSTITLLEIGA
jgi:hypothetical protein